MHVHVYHGGRQAKFWLEPNIELAQNSGLKPKQIKRVLQLIKENQDDIRSSWESHFGR
jgi:hypothetical protein